MAKKPTMADLQNFLKAREEKKNNRITYDTDIYPFWNMNTGESATVRILPEANEENPFPFIEKLEHKLSINGKIRKVPCPSMYGDPCPICDLSREYYDADDEANGKYYYRDSLTLCKAIVIEDPLPPNQQTGETFEGKVVTLQLGYQIMTKIVEQLGTFFDPDEDALPWDLLEGYNFVIKKTKQGKDYPKYDIGSHFERKPSAIPKKYLTDLELEDIKTLLPKAPDFDKVNELLEAHLSGGDAPSDSDSLENKKKASSTSNKSSSRSALARLAGDDNDEDEDDDDQSDLIEESDDEDDDDDDLRDIIAKVKRNKAK